MESTTWAVAQSPEDLLVTVQTRMGSVRGVRSTSRPTPTSLEVRAAARPSWTVWVAILLFPIGLLALLATEPRTLMFRVEPDPAGGSLLRVDGATVPATQKALVELWGSLDARLPVAV